jgi:hypothetical protein
MGQVNEDKRKETLSYHLFLDDRPGSPIVEERRVRRQTRELGESEEEWKRELTTDRRSKCGVGWWVSFRLRDQAS